MTMPLGISTPDAKSTSLTSKQSEWSPSSWRQKNAKQQPVYADAVQHKKALEKLETLPPLVTSSEIRRLREELKKVALNQKFLLHGGDCAEAFAYSSKDPIEAKIKVLLQMSLVLIWGAKLPVVKIARMAGQFAKPRSSPTEIVNGKEVPSFRGEIINGIDPDDREPDPKRLLLAYFHSATTLNCVRGLLSSGFASLHSPQEWSLGHVRSSTLLQEYTSTVTSVLDCVDFMAHIGADHPFVSEFLERTEIFTSHEALLLEYEEKLTRKHGNSWIDGSAHFIWVGERTRDLDGAHIEFIRGVENPVGIKLGPTLEGDELVKLLDIVNPTCEIGKVTLISRYGHKNVERVLPIHIEAVNSSRHAKTVIFSCDPMHGNTTTTDQGIKTRHYCDMISELTQSLEIHAKMGSKLQGVHFELTGEFGVTECVGGSMELEESELHRKYESFCDPRLNYEQSMDVAFVIAGKLREGTKRNFIGMGKQESNGKVTYEAKNWR